MSKELKVKLVEVNNDFHLVLEENGVPGDYVSLKEIIDVNLEQLSSQNSKISELIKDATIEQKVQAKLKDAERDAVQKFKDSSEYKKLEIQLHELDKEKTTQETQIQGLKDQLQQEKNNKKQEIQTAAKRAELNKQAEMQQTIDSLKDQLEQEKKASNERLQESIKQSKTELESQKTEITELKTQIRVFNENKKNEINLAVQSELENTKKTVRAEFSKEIEDLKRDKINLQAQLNLEKQNKANEIDQVKQTVLSEQKAEYLSQINELQRQNDILSRERNKSVKKIGNDLEKWCLEEYNKSFSGILQNTTFAMASFADNKINNKNQEEKPDFVFKVMNSAKANEAKIAIFEMKSEETNSQNKQKNDSFLRKLNKEMQVYNAEYGVIVSELESDQDNYYYWKVSPEYPKIFIVQPEAFLAIVRLIYAIFQKQIEIANWQAKKNLDFEQRERIDQNFNKLKEDFLKGVPSYVQDRIKDVKGKIETINQKAVEIQNIGQELLNDKIRVIENHIQSFVNKVENFNIHKITGQIEKLNNQTDLIENEKEN